MRLRAFGVVAAVLLMASAPASAAGAEQWADGSAARLAVPASQGASLLPADQLVAGGMGQWIWPGVAGGPYSGFALPQTAAFFGYSNSMNPLYQAGVLGNIGAFGTQNPAALTTLSVLNQTGLAPATALSLNSLVGLGVATTATNPAGTTLFQTGGLSFPLLPGQTLGGTSFGQLSGVPGVFQGNAGFAGFNPFLSQLGVNVGFVR
jgi:hypothetical protein